LVARHVGRAFLVMPGAARHPARRTFASAFQAPAHSEPAALRHPACACRLRRLTGRRAAPSPDRLRAMSVVRFW